MFDGEAEARAGTNSGMLLPSAFEAGAGAEHQPISGAGPLPRWKSGVIKKPNKKRRITGKRPEHQDAETSGQPASFIPDILQDVRHNVARGQPEVLAFANKHAVVASLVRNMLDRMGTTSPEKGQTRDASSVANLMGQVQCSVATGTPETELLKADTSSMVKLMQQGPHPVLSSLAIQASSSWSAASPEARSPAVHIFLQRAQQRSAFVACFKDDLLTGGIRLNDVNNLYRLRTGRQLQYPRGSLQNFILAVPGLSIRAKGPQMKAIVEDMANFQSFCKRIASNISLCTRTGKRYAKDQANSERRPKQKAEKDRDQANSERHPKQKAEKDDRARLPRQRHRRRGYARMVAQAQETSQLLAFSEKQERQPLHQQRRRRP